MIIWGIAMTTNRVVHDKNNPYTLLNTSIVFDKSVSGLGKALWLYAFSRPDDWQFYSNEMVKHFPEGIDAVSTALKTLEKAGYLERNQQRLSNGRMGPVSWVWHEVSKNKVPEPAKPVPVEPEPVNPRLPIIEVTPSIENTKLSVVPTPVGDVTCKRIRITTKNQGVIELTDSDLFYMAAVKNVDYTVKELSIAWNILGESKGVVHDWWKFLEGVVKNNRMVKKGKAYSRKASREEVHTEEKNEEQRVATPQEERKSVMDLLNETIKNQRRNHHES
jgi:hypothetical protein